MAQPRVFISSTYYDLKYVRSSLELFVESLGYEPVLSEKGGIAYAPDKALDESCYREVQDCDIYVLIIGGRYGSEASSSKTELMREFFETYESVTKLEHKAAIDKDIPVYILIEKSVYSEYHTYQKNRDSRDICYAHVDSVNVFRFIDEIMSRPRNNPIQSFDRYSEIEEWLRFQWAGLFRELMLRMSGQQQLATLASQVAELAEVNKTLRRYLEEVMAKVAPKEAVKIIKAETARLAEASVEQNLKDNPLIRYFVTRGIPFDIIRGALERAETIAEFQGVIRSGVPTDSDKVERALQMRSDGAKLRDLNLARQLVGKSKFTLEPRAAEEGLELPIGRADG